MKTDNNNLFMYVEQDDNTKKSFFRFCWKPINFRFSFTTKGGEDNKLRNKETEKSALDMK